LIQGEFDITSSPVNEGRADHRRPSAAWHHLERMTSGATKDERARTAASHEKQQSATPDR
jgi:hypothetical protein